MLEDSLIQLGITAKDAEDILLTLNSMTLPSGRAIIKFKYRLEELVNRHRQLVSAKLDFHLS